MSRARRRLALAFALVSSTAAARPMPVGASRPARSRSQAEPHLALRVVLVERGARWANCVFAGEPLAEAAGAGAPLRDRFGPGEPIWGRCYFPSLLALPKQSLVDRVFADGKKVWEQAYPDAAPAALSRSLDYAEVLRPVLAGLPAGLHRVRVEGVLHRGSHDTMLYRGEFRYAR